jgi:MFS family permease
MTDAATTRPLGSRDVLRIPDFRKLFAAQAISDIGDGMTYLALYLLVLQNTGSTAVIAAIAILIALPPVTIGLVAGAYADRLDRRRIMIVSDGLRAVIVGSIVLFQAPVAMPIVLALACLQAVVGTFFSPARSALVPRVVPTRGLLAANSLGQMSRIIGNVVGVAFTGAIAGATGQVWPAFLLDGLTFLASALIVLRVTRDVGVIDAVTTRAARDRGLRGSIGDGLRVIGHSRPLVATITGVTVTTLGVGAIEVLFVPFVVRDLAANPIWVGPIEGSQSASMILASLALGAFGARFRLSSLFVGGLFGVAACIALLSVAGNVWMVMAALFAVGWFVMPVQVSTTTIVQQATTDEIRGRAVGTLNAVLQTAQILSMAVAGIVAASIGIPAVFRIAAAITAIGGVLALILFRTTPAVQPAASTDASDAAIAL